MISMVIENLLQALGFQAHLADGFIVARSLHRHSFHSIVIVRNVKSEGDAFFLDIGSPLPLMRPIEVTQLMPSSTTAGVGNHESITTPTFGDRMCKYQVVKGKQLVAAFDEATQPNQEVPTKVASAYDLRKIQETLEEDEQDALVFALAKDDYVHTFFEKLREEPKGAWVPFGIFPRPLTTFDIDIIKDKMRNPKDPFTKLLTQVCLDGIMLAGFGRKSGDYLVIMKNKCLRYKGSETTKRQEGAEVGEMETMTTELELLESKQQLLHMVGEEFPQLLDYYNDVSEAWPELS